MNAEEQKWLPTHVQVTVVRGRGLRGKGKHGTSDVYTIIQVGKEKYSTCVVEKTTSPEWKEECSFELLPGVLENGGRNVYPAGSCDLTLTVMHRALIGLDVFLGQAVIPLDKAFQDNICLRNEWYRLNSKSGKKEKERGDIQVTVQFTRNNLTASMYDLAMKDKGHSTFSKLKDRITGKKRPTEEESSSAIVPGGHGTLCRMRNRLPSDGGGEEEYEDDEGGEARRSKMRNFFLRGKLRKSSDTRSSTSLGSESSESSSRGGSLSPTAGISVVVSDMSNSPSNSSNLTADNSPEHTANASPKLSPYECEFGDGSGEITITVPQPTICVNGSHAYNVQPPHPGSGYPAGPLGLGQLQKSLPLSMSLQNLSPRAEELPKGPAGDGRRWSFDKAGEEEKAVIAAALEKSGPMLGDEEEERLGLGQAVAPPLVSAVEPDNQGKKQRRNLFSHGRSESAGKGRSQAKDECEQAPAPAEEKHKGWFGSKDSHSKPSLVMSPTKLESSTDPPLPPLPPSRLPWGPPVDPGALSSQLHHTNPFSPAQTTPPPMSPGNPFFSLIQRNPFYGEMLTNQALKPDPPPELPPLPYLSSSRPPIAQLSLQSSRPNPTLSQDRCSTEDPVVDVDGKREVVADVKQRPLPPIPPEGKKPLSKKSSNPFMSGRAMDMDAEWDDSFEAFAAGRLQSPEVLILDCKPQQNTLNGPPLEHCNNKVASLSTTDTNRNTNMNYTLHPPTSDVPSPISTELLSEANEISSQVNRCRTGTPVSFAHLINTTPSYKYLEGDSKMLTTSSADAAVNSQGLNVCFETKLANNTANTTGITTNAHDALCHNCYHIHSTLSSCPGLKLDNNGPPNPGSSGVGSSAEEDVHSSLSLYSASERFSASSSEDVEAQDVDCGILGPCENSSEPPEVEIREHSDPSEVEIQEHSEVEILEHSEVDIFEHSDPSKVEIREHSDPSEGEIQKHSEVEIREHSEVSIFEHSDPSKVEIREHSDPSEVEIQEHSEVDIFGHSDPSKVEIQEHSDPFEGEIQEHSEVEIQEHSEVDIFGHSYPSKVEIQEHSDPFEVEIQEHSEVEIQEHSEVDIFGHSDPSKVEIREHSEVGHSEPSEVQILEFSESQDKVIEKSSDLSLDDVAQGPHNRLHYDGDKGELKSPERQDQSSTLQTVTPPQLPVKEVATDDTLILSRSLPDILCTDLQPKPLVSLQSDKDNGDVSSHDLKESIVNFSEELNNSITIKNTNTEVDILAIFDDENGQKHPSFCIVTSSPGDRQSLLESPTDGGGSGKQDFSGAPPKPARLFSDLDTSNIRTSLSPIQGFDDTLLHTVMSDQSPGSFLHSLYVSADSQQYQTCRSHQSSKCSEGIAPKQQVDMLPSANSTLYEGETYDEMGEFQCAVGTESIAAFCLEGSTNACRPTNDGNDQSEGLEFFQSGVMSVIEVRTAPLEPSFMIGDDFSLQILSDALTDSYINSKPDELTVGEGVGANQPVRSEDLFSEQPALQRSLSEGTMRTSFDDLMSFRRDPGMTQGSSSSAQHGSDLPLLTSSTPSLTAESSSPLALCSLPIPANATVSSPPSTAPATAPLCSAKPMSDAPHAVLPKDTQQQPQAANQQNSPHPVKPLTTATLGDEKRSEGRSVLASGLEKLKSTIHPGRSSQLSDQEPERKKSLTEGAGSYYHLNHSELVALLVQREAELERQKAEYKRQGALLTKREVELKKLKPQVRDLEDYIDTLLVRIMEQTPTLLQVRTKFK